MTSRRKTRVTRAGIFGLIIALLGSLTAPTPLGQRAESEWGLNWLFLLRGPRQPPDNLVVVTIDRESSDRLGLPNLPRKWPRTMHARLLENLSRQRVALVLFDIIFEEPSQAEHDQQFGAAIRKAGNVVLFERLQRELISLDGSAGGGNAQAMIETRVPPISPLENAALALAPFPLPKIPAKINQSWLFKPEVGDVPTLPVVALQIYALSVYDDLIELIREDTPEVIDEMPAKVRLVRENGSIQSTVAKLRRIFQGDSELADRLTERLRSTGLSGDSKKVSLLRALIDTYGGDHSRYINFYGPPRTIETIPYHRILEMDSDTTSPRHGRLFGKAVFVGFSEQLQPEQKDGFYTVYSQDTGLDISGVEIAATTFGNLLERRFVQRLATGKELAVVGLWGFILGFMLRLLPGQVIIPAVLGAGFLYLLAAHHLFGLHTLWLPLAVPLLWQAPFAALGALLWKYLETHREGRNIREAFDYHLPAEVVDRLSQGVNSLQSVSDQMYGICLATDAGQYTALSERLSPAELRDLMNRYYNIVFTPVRAAGGIVSDVKGDAMLAIWTTPKPESLMRRQACDVALAIIEAVDAFCRQPEGPALPTRIGLHCGDLVLGHVGAVDHYEYRAVGDSVNVSTRLESLNKQLGTRILLSRDMVENLDGYLTRELGSFLLMGKSQPMTVYELIGQQEQASLQLQRVHRLFADGLSAFRAQRWEQATLLFQRATELDQNDGPSRFYIHLAGRYQNQPPRNWDGVVRLQAK